MLKENSDMYKRITRQLERFGHVQGLMRYINEETLLQKHKRLPKDKATGIDKVTKEEYDANIEENIGNLIYGMKHHQYKPQPVDRKYIPKANGKTRPLGIPTYEDKLVQAQVAEILNIIFDRYFKDFSFGYREGKSAQQAVEEIDNIIMHKKVNFIFEADIKGFFDHVVHEILLRMLEVVIEDRDFIELIRKFLKAGYMENGELKESEEGTPQGGIISPILANLYLHVVLDTWFENEFKKLCKGEVYIVRYCDDFVCMFQYKQDVELLSKMIVSRFEQFGLELEPTKTKSFPFGRYCKEKTSFDFLGFTFTNGKTRNNYYRVSITTSKKKSKLKYKELIDFIKENRTTKPNDLIDALNRKLVGMYNYYGISGNYLWMIRLYNTIKSIIRKWLSRRSQRGKITWDKMQRIFEFKPLIKPTIKYQLW